MTHFGSSEQNLFSEEFLANLAENDQEDVFPTLLDRIRQTGGTFVEAAATLAMAALQTAESAPHKAARWLELAQQLQGLAPQPLLEAQIAYAQARLHLQQGQLSAAEASLRHAQAIWQKEGDSAAAARTFLGLTQILTLQGNYTDAQTAISEAITILDKAIAEIPTVAPLLVVALRNQANLYGYLHDHQQALALYERAQQTLDNYCATGATIVDEPQIAYEEACIALSRAVDLMALARLQEAEHSLTTAIAHFERSGDQLHSSHSRSNLASLYARTGQYRQALATYEQAIETLWGKETQLDALPIAELQAADVMLLDQAMVFLALNWQRAALHALLLAEKLFSQTQRPYELAQTLYAKGLLHIQEQHWEAASAALEKAEATFDQLQNRYWRNRAIMARISLLQQQEKGQEAWELLEPLTIGIPTALEEQWYGWDLGTATELYLQRIQLLLQFGDVVQAKESATIIAQLFYRHFADTAPTNGNGPDTAQYVTTTDDLVTYGVPHLRFAYLYAQGRIECADGNLLGARTQFQQAVTLLEAQRATLPLEEIRIAFLGDKAAIYTDWLLTFLNLPTMDEQSLKEAFTIVERARSRALLERLLATLEDQLTTDENVDECVENKPIISKIDTLNQNETVAFQISDTQALLSQPSGNLTVQRVQLRRHLYWLYNQLLDQDGRQRAQSEQLQMIRQLEYRLEQLEAQSVLSNAVTPADVNKLQSVLQPTEQVLAYYIAGDEVLLFLVTKSSLQLFRNLCTVPELNRAHRDLLFQMGRVRTADIYLHDLDNRSQRLLFQALQRLGQLLLEPVLPYLVHEQLQIIPYGVLHQLPFHAFRTNNHYLIEQYRCQYIPSASIAVHQRERQHAMSSALTWSGIAVTDQGIPETANEVKMIANLFTEPHLYVGKEANKLGFKNAAQEADILHISTHGLMRHDNPLFSSLKLTDSWIDVREIYQLELRAQLVVLSACRSGSSQISQGDELLGLVRGFLGAGAQALLVSQWDVNDAYAPHFMVQFYQQLLQHDKDPATAIRQAQCHAIAEGHHPFWWAPFYVIG